MKKNKYFKYIFVLLLFTGCGEDWLNVENKNQLTKENFFKTQDDATYAVTGAYAAIKLNQLFGLQLQFYFYGMDDRTVHESTNAENLLHKSDDGTFEGAWSALYSGIRRVNMALDEKAGIPSIEKMSDSLRTQYLGELYFLRGLYNFYLVTFFNRAPLVTTVIELENSTLGNSEPAEFWTQIESDLDKAIANLSIKYKQPGDLGRATKGAAMALKGKAFIYQEKWQQAKDIFDQLFLLNAYSLSQPKGTDSLDYVYAFMCNFTYTNLTNGGNTYVAENNSESVFEIQNNDDPSFWNEMLPGYGCNGSVLSSFFGLYGFKNVSAHANLIKQFEKPGPGGLIYDPRKYATIWEKGEIVDDVNPTGTFYNAKFDPKVNLSQAANTGYGLKKYYYPIFNKDPKVDPTNWRLIRYSDVLLMACEAEYHIAGSTAYALDKINQVRRRAGMPDVTVVTPQAITHERDVEFAGEIVRPMDLIRWSKPSVGWASVKDSIYNFQDKNMLMAIPLYEINIMQGKLVQNSGW